MKKNQFRVRSKYFGVNGPNRVCTERDFKILMFLWRWKLASTATIHEAVGNGLTPYSTFKTMERLEKFKYVEARRNVGINFSSWCLTDQAFEILKPFLKELCQEGFQSENHWHDRNALAFQLGEWASHDVQGVTFWTEQELRRYGPEYYPEWVPSTTGHRPDGYTQIKGSKKDWLIAIEVEMWAKPLSFYETTMRYYELVKSIDKVFWLVADQQALTYIQKAKAKMLDATKNLHYFVDQQEYFMYGWDAIVTNDSNQKAGTFREQMQGLLGEMNGKRIANKWGKSKVHAHYAIHKTLGR